MKKILLFTNSGCGGAERITILYAKILYNAGYQVKLIVYNPALTKPEISTFIPDYIHAEYISCKYRFLFLRFFTVLRNNRPSIIFSSFPLLSHILVFLCKLYFKNIKIIMREINMPSTHKKSILLKNSIAYKYGDLLIAQTNEMGKEMTSLYNIDSSRIVVINNPIDTERIDAGLSEPFRFDHNYVNYVAVGRVARQKDYITLLRAFKEVINCEPNSRLYILGKCCDDYYHQLLNLIGDLSVGDKVFFLGVQANPYKYMKDASCFVLSSIYEGLPNVLLEAIYIGIPCVATDCIPFISQVIDSKIGQVVPVGDVELMSEAMLAVAKHEKYEGVDLNGSNKALIVGTFGNV